MRRNVLLAVVAVVGCKKSAPEERPIPPKPGAALKPGEAKRSHSQGMYFVIVPNVVDATDVERILHEEATQAQVLAFSVDRVLKDRQRPFALRHLSAEDAAAVASSTAAVGITGNGDDALALTHALASAAAVAAEKMHGWVYEPARSQVFTPASFNVPRVGTKLDVRDLITVTPLEGDDGMVGTGGVRDYGFPELFMLQVPTSNEDEASTLLYAAAQVLVDGQDVTPRGEIVIDLKQLGWDVVHAGGTGKATLQAVWAAPVPADGDFAIELRPVGGSSPESVGTLMRETFGE